jgi:hypothetical protein
MEGPTKPMICNRKVIHGTDLARERAGSPPCSSVKFIDMYLVLTLIFAILSWWLHLPGFMDLPLGQITPRMLVSQFLVLGFGFLALVSLSLSIEKDPVWPWSRRFRTLFRQLFAIVRR